MSKSATSKAPGKRWPKIRMCCDRILTGSEKIKAGTMFEEKAGDVGTPHVRCSTQARLEVARTPIPSRIDECGICREEFLRERQIFMSCADKILNPLQGNRRGTRRSAGRWGRALISLRRRNRPSSGNEGKGNG